MIKLRDTDGLEFKLLKNRATDSTHYATRRNIRIAINRAINQGSAFQFQKYGVPAAYLSIRRKNLKDTGFTGYMHVGVIYKNGTLQLGCHEFNRKTSRKIIYWARIPGPDSGI